MRCGLAKLATGLVCGALVGASALASAAAAEMKPEEAKRFIAGKLFSYTCFDGTRGAGRIQSDGSVVGTMQVNTGRVKFVAFPAGTIKLSSDSICAALPHAIFQPCFNVVQTSPNSFRGSLKALGFAYCDFVRHNPRMDLARTETVPPPPSMRTDTIPTPHVTPTVQELPAPQMTPAPQTAAAPPAAESAAELRPSKY